MKAELLAPAGSYESLTAAVSAGADAVYIGGTLFGARAYADNLSAKQMLAAIDFCHLHGCKLYLTVNTLLKEKEFSTLYDYILPFYKQGLDAVIVQDIGVLTFLRHSFPELEIHASTQMSITGVAGAQFLESLGVSRIVLARELSLGEIKTIHDGVSLEIESFVHGALCYCYSGQCLYSSLIGGRSGNRGRCAQPCRLPYRIKDEQDKQEAYWLSPKDICTLELLPDIIEAGVFSLKIEGRMKRPEYTAGVVRIYRKYLDYYCKHGRAGYHVSQEDIHELMVLYNRGGFSTGYYQKRNGSEMLSLQRANHFGTEAAKVTAVKRGSVELRALEDLHAKDMLENDTLAEDVKKGDSFKLKMPANTMLRQGMILHKMRDQQLLDRLYERYINTKSTEKINGNLMILAGKPVILNVNMGTVSVSVSGDLPGMAVNQPLTEEKVRKQLEKTGNTPFVFEKLRIQIDEGLFMPLQSLNELRRNALEQLEAKILSRYRRNDGENFQKQGKRPNQTECEPVYQIYAAIENLDLFANLNEIPELDGIYLDCNCLHLPLSETQVSSYVNACHAANKKCFYIMPHIYRQELADYFESAKSLAALRKFDGILIKNYESFFFLKTHHFKNDVILDHNLYTYHHLARVFWRKQGITYDTAPLELNDKELLERGSQDSEMIVYGHLPMMVSAQCLRKTVKGCAKASGLLWLTDRKHKHFPVKNHCTVCYQTIYNPVPLVLIENKKEIDRLGISRIRLNFTIETPEQANKITHAYVQTFKKEQPGKLAAMEFTRGHFKRGIE